MEQSAKDYYNELKTKELELLAKEKLEVLIAALNGELIVWDQKLNKLQICQQMATELDEEFLGKQRASLFYQHFLNLHERRYQTICYIKTLMEVVQERECP